MLFGDNCLVDRGWENRAGHVALHVAAVPHPVVADKAMGGTEPGNVTDVGSRGAVPFKVGMEDALPEVKLAGCVERLTKFETVLKFEYALQ